MGAQGEVLRAIEVNPLLFGVLQSHIVSADVDLVEISAVAEHFPFRLSEETLHVLGVQLVGDVLVLGRHGLLGAEALHGRCEAQRAIHQQLVPRLDVDVDVLEVVLARGDALVELAASSCLRARPVRHVAALERDGSASVIVAFPFGVAGAAFVARSATRSATLVGHLVLRNAELGALADALAAAAFDDVDLGGVFVRGLPTLDGAAVGGVPVVLRARTSMRCRTRRVGAGGSGERLVRLVLPVLLRGGRVRLVVLAQGGIHASADRVVEGSHVLDLGVLEADEGGLLPDLVVLMQPAVGATSGCAASELGLRSD